MKTAEEIYTEWFGGESHTTRRSPSKRNVIAAMEEYAQSVAEDLRERIAENARTTSSCTVWNCEGESVDK